MTTHLSLFDEFMLHFTTLKNAAKGDPSRISSFHKDSQAIKDAVDAMERFLLRSDFERRVFHGPVKYFSQVPEKLEPAWDEYSQNWADIVSSTYDSMHLAPETFSLGDKRKKLPETFFSGETFVKFDELAVPEENLNKSRDELERDLTKGLEKKIKLEPDEHFLFSLRFGKIAYRVAHISEDFRDGMTDPNEEFDPRKHDGACLIQGLISYLRELVEENSEPAADIENFKDDIRVALGAYDYLTETIGLNVADIFWKWQSVPIIFTPSHVSNRYGQTEKGSLNDLMNDAVRAYVFGAPAAAIAMCRAALEKVLKKHYGKGEWDDPTLKLKLGEIIVLASQRYHFIQEGKLGKLTRSANTILHNYSKRERMSDQDDRTILEFLKTVKFLIQRAPN